MTDTPITGTPVENIETEKVAAGEPQQWYSSLSEEYRNHPLGFLNLNSF